MRLHLLCKMLMAVSFTPLLSSSTLKYWGNVLWSILFVARFNTSRSASPLLWLLFSGPFTSSFDPTSSQEERPYIVIESSYCKYFEGGKKNKILKVLGITEFHFFIIFQEHVWNEDFYTSRFCSCFGLGTDEVVDNHEQRREFLFDYILLLWKVERECM